MIAIVPGFLAGLSLIIAIGAQNAFVIRQGLTKKFVLLTVLICAFSDALLIALGASGLGALIKANKNILEFVRWFGVAYLLWFAFKSARSAFKKEVLKEVTELLMLRITEELAVIRGETPPKVVWDRKIEWEPS
jgi:L-lysine exporter family protein LysE/ArgO